MKEPIIYAGDILFVVDSINLTMRKCIVDNIIKLYKNRIYVRVTYDNSNVQENIDIDINFNPSMVEVANYWDNDNSSSLFTFTEKVSAQKSFSYLLKEVLKREEDALEELKRNFNLTFDRILKLQSQINSIRNSNG